MSSNTIVYLGVDVAKATLQFDGPCARATTEIINHPRAIAPLLKALQRLYPQLHLIFESTGGCERALQATAHSLGLAFTQVDPWRVRNFARSVGILEKTDAIDAAILRRYGQAVQPTVTVLQEQTLRTLRSWVQLRDHYVARRREEETFIGSLAEPALRRIAEAESRHLDRLIEKLDEKIQRFLDEQAPALNDAVQTLCLVSGVASRSATGLLAYLPEMGRCSGQQIAKLAGLAPISDDSGPRRGPRHIARGRAPARRVLYMIALVAARFNEHSRRFYLRLRAAGKPPKVAIIAVARKLLVFLNSLLKPAYSTA